MNSSEVSPVIRSLAYEWYKLRLPAQRIAYNDFILVIVDLYVSTDDLARTQQICRVVMKQASDLRKSSEWVEQELQFEAQAEMIGDRREWLRFELAAHQASDAALDLYNERVNRFTVMS